MDAPNPNYVPPPVFEAKVPGHLLAGKSDSEKWIYNQISIQGQQNDWLIYRQRRWGQVEASNSVDMFNIKRQVADLIAWRDSKSKSWGKIVATGVLIVPCLIIVAWECFKHWMKWDSK